MKIKINDFFNMLKIVLGIFSTILFLTYLNFSESYAQEKITCAESLIEAEANYNAGNWEESIRLINNCLSDTTISKNDRGEAYRLLGLIYIAQELEKEANNAVKNLLIMVPNYKSDPDRDPPPLQRMIDDVSQQIIPSIFNISPNTTESGSEEITIIVNGSDFVYGASVQFNGFSKSTVYVNQNQLSAVLTAYDLEKQGEFEVTVFSPIKGKTSNPVKFAVTEASSFPWTWIAVGGGVVAGAVAAVLLLGGEDDNGDEGILPTPPGRP